MKRTPLVVASCAAALVTSGALVAGQQAGSAPADRPFGLAMSEEAFDEMLEACTARARATWPSARDRFLGGLGDGHALYAVTKVRDSAGRFEQIFVEVTGVEHGRIIGRIASEIKTVAGFDLHDPIRFEEQTLVDWAISRPDGSEEGNLVGKFMDDLLDGRTQPPCDPDRIE